MTRSQPAIVWLQARNEGRKASSSGLSFADTGVYFSMLGVWMPVCWRRGRAGLAEPCLCYSEIPGAVKIFIHVEIFWFCELCSEWQQFFQKPLAMSVWIKTWSKGLDGSGWRFCSWDLHNRDKEKDQNWTHFSLSLAYKGVYNLWMSVNLYFFSIRRVSWISSGNSLKR